MKTSILLPLFLLCLMCSGCKSLDPAGPYQGNQVLYDADVVIAASYDAIHTFVRWEFDNRAALSQFPSIKVSADEIRRQAPGAFRTAIMLRDNYEILASDVNKTSLQQAVSMLRQMTITAIGLMSRYQTASGTPINPATLPPMP